MMALAIQFTHYDLKLLRAGITVEITLAAVANVRLMTAKNFALYKEAMKHQFIGGVARKSPIRLTIPQAGHWHVVVDMEGHHGQSESSIRIVETAPAPRFQSAS
ncbi:hypothetical protein QO002_002118 [Pararhizobium capsulatum DSM 1112]|uniref:DUF1883 domain-containing protein n=1 Tax=Pararhizobium capsulatum DSM 1112 TaxID=1121113 RepID=A0ABU0BP01_9HYPH|nr:DUF1883 domain-containing protein [Pararhizobium capsulatum]MDQ0319980.1 hypothetical protein [Pararhizobium capsulatum DSM 1112]